MSDANRGHVGAVVPVVNGFGRLRPAIAMVDQVTLRQFLRAFGLFAVSFSLGLGVWMHMLDGVGWLILAGHVSAILSCLWAGAAVVLPRGGAHAPTSLAQIPALAALVAGTVAAVMQAVILTIRLIGVAVELSAVSPWFASGRVGFWPGGVWAFGLVGAACLLGLVRTRDRRLWVCLFWCVVLGLVWDAVAGPAICRTQTGSWMRTGVSFDLLVRLSAAMVVGVAWTRWVRFPSSGCWSGDDKRWPGFDASCVVLALAVSALAGFHLAVPFSGWGGGLRSATILTAVSAGMGALALYTLLRRRFGVGLCDAGMALSSLALASVVVAAVPNEPTDLSRPLSSRVRGDDDWFCSGVGDLGLAGNALGGEDRCS